MVKTLIFGLSIFLSFVSCDKKALLKTKQKTPSSETSHIRETKILTYKNYNKPVYLEDIYRTPSYKGGITSLRFIFNVDIIGSKLSLRNKVPQKLRGQLEKENLVSDKDILQIDKVWVSNKFNTYLLYVSDKEQFFSEKKLYLINYKNNHLLSVILVSRSANDIDSSTLSYSQMNRDRVWKIIYTESYAGSETKQKKWLNFIVNDNGYVKVVK